MTETDIDRLVENLTPEKRDQLIAKLLSETDPETETEAEPEAEPAPASADATETLGADVLAEIEGSLPEPTQSERDEAAARDEARAGHVEGTDLFAPSKDGKVKVGSMRKGGDLPDAPNQRSVDAEVDMLTADLGPSPETVRRQSSGPLPPPPEDQDPKVKSVLPEARRQVNPEDIPNNSVNLDTNPANNRTGVTDALRDQMSRPPAKKAPDIPPVPDFAKKANAAPAARDGRPLTFAEQVGPARRDERAAEETTRAKEKLEHALADPERNYTVVDVTDPRSSLCPAEMCEAQPANFRPYDLLGTRIRQFLESPRILNGAELANRVQFQQVDLPSVPTEEAEAAGFRVKWILARPLNKTANKWFLGYTHPGVETLQKALRTVLLTLKDWSVGKELEPEMLAAYAVERNMTLSDGSRLTDPEGRPMSPKKEVVRYRPKIRIFQPFEYPEQVAVVMI